MQYTSQHTVMHKRKGRNTNSDFVADQLRYELVNYRVFIVAYVMLREFYTKMKITQELISAIDRVCVCVAEYGAVITLF